MFGLQTKEHSKLGSILKFIPNLKINLFIIIIFQFLSGIFESLSIISLLPLVAYFIGEQQDKLILIQYLESFFEFLNIPLSLNTFISLTISLIILKAFFSFFAQYYQANLVEKSLLNTRNTIIRMLPKLSWEEAQKLSSGFVTSQIQLEIQRIGIVLRNIISIIGFILYLIFYAVSSSIVSIEITLCAIFLGLFKAFILNFLTKRIKKVGIDHTNTNNKLSSVIIEGIQNIKLLRAMGKENFFINRLFKNISDLKNIQIKSIVIQTLHRNLDEVGTTFILCGILLIMTNFFEVGIVQFGIVAILMNRILVKIAQVQKSQLIINGNMSSINNINKLLNNWKLFFNKGNKKNIRFKKSISFKKVDINIGKKRILSNLNLKLFKNKFYLVYGRSGIGKSTFVETLFGLRLPVNGKILIDNVQIKGNIDLIDWCNKIGYVPQDSSVFGDTIIENLTLGKKHIDKKLIYDALSYSDSLNFINNLPEGLNTKFYERGKNFSAGQIQRLAIARAIIHAKEILILDEATANLDKITEAKILKNLKVLSKKMTIILISHQINLKKYVNKTIKF